MVAEEAYTVEQVTGCMDRIVELEWNWTVNTVRKWIADFAAGKMPSKNGDDSKPLAPEYQKIEDRLAMAHDPSDYDKGTSREATDGIR